MHDIVCFGDQSANAEKSWQLSFRHFCLKLVCRAKRNQRLHGTNSLFFPSELWASSTLGIKARWPAKFTETRSLYDVFGVLQLRVHQPSFSEGLVREMCEVQSHGCRTRGELWRRSGLSPQIVRKSDPPHRFNRRLRQQQSKRLRNSKRFHHCHI